MAMYVCTKVEKQSSEDNLCLQLVCLGLRAPKGCGQLAVVVAAFSIRIDITSRGYHMIPLFVERPLLGHI